MSLTDRFFADVRSSDAWSANILSDGPVVAPDGELEELTIVELRREEDGAVGFATLTGAAPGDAAQEEFVSLLHEVILESSQGAALPPCPGHQHPQTPNVADGTLTWLCPLKVWGVSS
ncbi:MAG: hypothetical protein QM695_01450 [Micropruina sp.]